MTGLRYPHTSTVDQVDDYHGTEVADPYRWLEDPDAPEVRAWIDAQNDLTRSWLDEVPQRERIRRRLEALWDFPRAGAPWRRGRRWFQLRNTGLQDQDVLWTMDSPDDAGRVLLDPNTASPDGTVALSAAVASHDGELLAYATSAAGSDWMTWRVRRVVDGTDLDDTLEWSKFSGAAWLPDGSAFFYARYDPPAPGTTYQAANRNQRLHLHRLGTPQEDDALVYARPDEPEWGFAPTVTEDGRYLLLHVWQGTHPHNRVYYRQLDDDEVVPLLDDFDAGYDFVGNDGARFFFQTDLDAPRGRVVAIDVDDPRREAWTEVIAESDDTLESVHVVGGRLLAVYLHHARHRLRRFTLDGRPDGDVDLPDVSSVSSLTGRSQDEAAYFSVTTFTSPAAVWRHDVATGRTELVRAPAAVDSAHSFRTRQVFATSSDGTRIPMFLVHRDDLDPGRVPLPTLLYGYGGFGIPLTPAFSVSWLVWLELGGVLAVANLRGGGEYGQDWHDAGRGRHKQNVFDDALACAEWLVAEAWTTPAQLGITGGSNGGLLAAACLIQRPDAFGACVPEVGVLDMLRFHRFTIGWAWTSDYGSADEPQDFPVLAAYSPLHNVRDGVAYPATLITTGDHDDRVVPAHSFKFAAALQAAQAGPAPILLRVQTDAGHGAGKPTSMLIAERTDVLAFLWATLGHAKD